MLSRELIVDAAFSVLRDYGLADLSMRRLAKELGVQAGALYWHVPSKQDLLYGLAEVLLADLPSAKLEIAKPETAEPTTSRDAARQLALDLRERLLPVRDSAEVVSLAQALAPYALAPFAALRRMLDDDAVQGRGSRVLIHFILGALAEEQTRASLIDSGAVQPETDAVGAAQKASAAPQVEQHVDVEQHVETAAHTAQDDFAYGVDAILSGLAAVPAPRA